LVIHVSRFVGALPLVKKAACANPVYAFAPNAIEQNVRTGGAGSGRLIRFANLCEFKSLLRVLSFHRYQRTCNYSADVFLQSSFADARKVFSAHQPVRFHTYWMPKMSSESENCQNETLNALRNERKRVAVFLVNGIKLVGYIESFDQYLVMLSSAGGTQVVYKHGISTVQEDTGKSLRPLGPRNGLSAPRDVGRQTGGDSLSNRPHATGMD